MLIAVTDKQEIGLFADKQCVVRMGLTASGLQRLLPHLLPKKQRNARLIW